MSKKESVKTMEFYEIEAGFKVYTFKDVPLTLSPRGRLGLTAGTVREMMIAISNLILAKGSEERLFWDEFDMLALTAEMSIRDASLQESPAKIMEWRSQGYVGSAKKEKMLKHISKFIPKKSSMTPSEVTEA